MKTKLISLLALAVAAGCQASPYTEPLGPSQGNFGGVGLWQVPTGRMAPEGEFNLNLMDNDQYRFYSLSLQMFPWLDTTLRYTDVRTRLYGAQDFSGNQTYKDKSMDIKLRLWQESYWLPETSVGIRDIGGTGLFDAEYLVATKAWGPVDFTLGIGWGYLGTRDNISNPFCDLNDSFCRRDHPHNNDGGQINSKDAFHGSSAVFGGIEYQTPWQPLRLKVEYEGNNYKQDFAGSLPQNTPINVGFVYRLTDWADVNMSYQRGNTLMAGISLRTNFNTLHQGHIDEPPVPYQPKSADSVSSEQHRAEQLALLDANAGYSNPAIAQQGHTLYVMGEQDTYRDNTEAVDRANHIMMNNLPEGIDTIVVTDGRMGLPLTSTVTDVDSLKESYSGYALGEEKPLKQRRTEPEAPTGAVEHYIAEKERLQLGWSPVINQSLGGPENFYMYQVGLSGTADYWLTDHLVASGELFLNLFNNYSQFKFVAPPPDTHIPRVRTHIREYVDGNDLYLNSLQLSYLDTLLPSVYGQVYGGYLEQMFGGVGGEVLYRPLDRPWALGLDVNYAKQRDWDAPMQFADYSVTTGHVSAYWQPQFMDNVLVRFSVGRYLAEDWGATLNLAKRFDSGIIAGVYATKTDVSSQEYGEGSFTKGFYISIPLDLLTVRSTTSRALINWSPLTRDGGQMLQRPMLYDMTDSRSPYYQY